MKLEARFEAKIAKAAKKLVLMEGELSPGEWAAKREELKKAVATWLAEHGVEVGPKFLEVIVQGSIGAARVALGERGEIPDTSPSERAR